MLSWVQSEVIDKKDFSEKAAAQLDERDPFKALRKQFELPRAKVFEDDTISLRSEYLYFAASALGLQPKGVRKAHFDLWRRYDDATPAKVGLAGEVALCAELSEKCLCALSRLLCVGSEDLRLFANVRPMLALSLLAAHLQRPGSEVIVADSLPPLPDACGKALPVEDIVPYLHAHAGQVSVMLVPLIHRTTAVEVDLVDFVVAAKHCGCLVGVEVSDGVGSKLPLDVKESDVDFAVFSTERYLNGGPDSLTGVFLHDRHRDASSSVWDRFAKFEQGSCAVYRLSALRESLDIFEAQPLPELADKAAALQAYLGHMLAGCGLETAVSLSRTSQGGSCVALRAEGVTAAALLERRVVIDEREGYFVVSLVPLYTSFLDVFRLAQHLLEILTELQAAPAGVVEDEDKVEEPSVCAGEDFSSDARAS